MYLVHKSKLQVANTMYICACICINGIFPGWSYLYLYSFWSFDHFGEVRKQGESAISTSQSEANRVQIWSNSVIQSRTFSKLEIYLQDKEASCNMKSVDQFSYSMELLELIVQPLTSVLSKFSASWKIKFFQIFCWWKTFIGLRTFISPMEGRNGETLLSKSPYKNW